MRPVVNNVLTLNDLAARVESETSFSVSDVKGLVEAFQKYISGSPKLAMPVARFSKTESVPAAVMVSVSCSV